MTRTLLSSERRSLELFLFSDLRGIQRPFQSAKRLDKIQFWTSKIQTC